MALQKMVEPHTARKNNILIHRVNNPKLSRPARNVQFKFSLPKKDVKLGNYTVYAATKYYIQTHQTGTRLL